MTPMDDSQKMTPEEHRIIDAEPLCAHCQKPVTKASSATFTFNRIEPNVLDPGKPSGIVLEYVAHADCHRIHMAKGH